MNYIWEVEWAAMVFDNLVRNISRHVTLNSEELEAFCQILKVRTVKKKSFLFKLGQVCDQEAYINKGCFRMFFCDKEGVEHTFYFGVEDWWISDIYSRTFHSPSNYIIEALEDSEVFLISDRDFELYVSKFPKIERFYRKLFQYSLAIFEKRLLDRHQLNSEERYRNFRKSYPHFDKRIPQKHIASYLGLTPEFFNTVRSKVLKTE